MTKRFGPGLAAVLLCTVLLAGGAATAEPANGARPEPSASTGEASSLPPAEAEDYETYKRAMDDMAVKGYRGLGRDLAGLREALDRAPASYPVIETEGEQVIVRANESSETAPLVLAALLAASREGVSASVVAQPNVYPMIALLLGSHAVEYGRFDEAIGYLNRGLKLQPYNWLLVTEKAAALQGQHKWAESIAFVDEALAGEDAVLMRNTGSLHRKRGFALTELGRLDEAEAAYQESLKAEPGNKLALQELEYIRSLRAGGPKAGMELVAPASKP